MFSFKRRLPQRVSSPSSATCNFEEFALDEPNCGYTGCGKWLEPCYSSQSEEAVFDRKIEADSSDLFNRIRPRNNRWHEFFHNL